MLYIYHKPPQYTPEHHRKDLVILFSIGAQSNQPAWTFSHMHTHGEPIPHIEAVRFSADISLFSVKSDVYFWMTSDDPVVKRLASSIVGVSYFRLSLQSCCSAIGTLCCQQPEEQQRQRIGGSGDTRILSCRRNRQKTTVKKIVTTLTAIGLLFLSHNLKSFPTRESLAFESVSGIGYPSSSN